MAPKLALPISLLAILAGLGLSAWALDAPERAPQITSKAPQPERTATGDRPEPEDAKRPRPRTRPRIEWRDSTAFGAPESGSLARGVQLPREGRTFFTWDPILRQRPNRPWRRWGTDILLRTTLGVLRDFARAHPGAPRVGIGDLSLPEGGDFGPEVGGGIGHATHQNGLDVDVYYPLRSGKERAPLRVGEIDLRLAQDLVDRFLAAGATRIYVGPSTGLEGPGGTVVPLVNHDNHLHVRISG